jgi:hypothetical protein
MMARRALDPDLGDLTKLSRVELEPVMWTLNGTEEQARADAIAAELATRTWQGLNPYRYGVPAERG